MIIKTDALFPNLETDCEEMKELVNLYNIWYSDTAFRSYWPPSNKFWDQLKEYCINHKELVVDFWLQLYERYNEVGHFTYMLHELFPDALQFEGHCPLNHVEKAWMMFLMLEKSSKKMTNEDLIVKLLQYPKDAEVVYSYINPIGEDVEVEPKPYYNEFSRKIYL